VTGRAFVDTNVWVYAVDTADERKQARALAVLDREMRHGVVLSAQVIGEYYVTTTRKLDTPLTPAAALEDVRDMTAVLCAGRSASRPRSSARSMAFPTGPALVRMAHRRGDDCSADPRTVAYRGVTIGTLRRSRHRQRRGSLRALRLEDSRVLLHNWHYRKLRT